MADRVTVFDDAIDAAGDPVPAGTRVDIHIIGADKARVAEDEKTIIRKATVRCDEDGHWEADLYKNEDLLPEGTAYYAQYRIDGFVNTIYFYVEEAGWAQLHPALDSTQSDYASSKLVRYKPTNTGDWENPDPTNVGDALDVLAANSANETALTAETSARTSADTTLQNNINSEASTRATADTTLQANIDAEATARASAVSAEATARTNADNAEATARANADTTIQTNIDNHVNDTSAAHAASAVSVPAVPEIPSSVVDVAAAVARLAKMKEENQDKALRALRASIAMRLSGAYWASTQKPLAHTLKFSPTPTSGTFKLKVQDQDSGATFLTGTLNYNDGADVVEQAIKAAPFLADDPGVTGTATSGSSTTLVDSGKSWTTNQWSGYGVRITAGTGSGQRFNIVSNTATTLTISDPVGGYVAPDSTSQYKIVHYSVSCIGTLSAGMRVLRSGTERSPLVVQVQSAFNNSAVLTVTESGGPRFFSNHAVIGDSLTVLGAMDGLMAKLQTRINYYPFPAGTLLPQTTFAGWDPATFTGTVVSDVSDSTRGVTGTRVELTNGQVCDFRSINWDYLEIFYWAVPSGGATVYMNAVAIGGDLSSTGSGSYFSTWSTTDATLSAPELRRKRIQALGDSGWDVRLKVEGSGTAKIDIVQFHRNGSNSYGANYYRLAHSGYDSNEMITLGHVEEFARIVQPDSIFYTLGTNDYTTGDQSGANTFKANLNSLIDSVIAVSPLSSVIVVIPHQSASRPGWDYYVKACKEIRASRGDTVAIVDLSEALGDFGELSDVLSLSDDQVHQNALGSALWSDAIANKILGPLLKTVPYVLADGSQSFIGPIRQQQSPKIGYTSMSWDVFGTYKFDIFNTPLASYPLMRITNQSGFGPAFLVGDGTVAPDKGIIWTNLGDGLRMYSTPIDLTTIGGAITGQSWAINKGYVDAFTINTQTGTSYTLVLTDQGKLVTLNNASPVTLTIPTNASVAFPTGTRVNIINLGAGTVTVAGAGGVTLSSEIALTIPTNGRREIIKVATNTWILST